MSATIPPASTPRRPVASRSYREELTASTARTLGRRRVVNYVMVGLTYAAAIIATLPLMFILVYLLKAGASSVNWNFFTKMPAPTGETGGGMANAILGTGMLVLLASAVGL